MCKVLFQSRHSSLDVKGATGMITLGIYDFEIPKIP